MTLTARPEVEVGNPALNPDPGFVDDPAVDYRLQFQPGVAVFDDGTAFDVEVLADVPGDDSFQSTLDLARDGDSEGLTRHFRAAVDPQALLVVLPPSDGRAISAPVARDSTESTSLEPAR